MPELVSETKILADAYKAFDSEPTPAGFVLAKITKGFGSPVLQNTDWEAVKAALAKRYGTKFCVVVVSYADGMMDVRIEKEAR